MKNIWLILGVLGVGGLAYYAYNKKKNSPKVLDAEKIAEEIKAKDEKKFTNAFLSQYDVVVAPTRVSAKAKMEADDLISSRRQKQEQRYESYKPSFI